MGDRVHTHKYFNADVVLVVPATSFDNSVRADIPMEMGLLFSELVVSMLTRRQRAVSNVIIIQHSGEEDDRRNRQHI